VIQLIVVHGGRKVIDLLIQINGSEVDAQYRNMTQINDFDISNK
jgi:hypothetical protein